MQDDALNKLVNDDAKTFIGLAGPGTGKSFTFRTIAENDKFKDKKILVLSFINKLVDDLSTDFNEFANVDVSTLHSFALKEYQRLVSDAKVKLVDDLDSIVSEDYKLLKNLDIDFVRKICELDLSNEEEQFYKDRSAYYQNRYKIYSFNSIIHAVNKIYSLKNNHVNDAYDLILVDEFQDFNKLEYEFIRHLNTKNKVVLVGDDDQSLYGWKYAEPSLIRALYHDEDNVSFSLDYCFRCTKVMVDAVNSLISNAKTAGYLSERADDKKYLYPHKPGDDKYKISETYPAIEFMQKLAGDKLIYSLASNIAKDVGSSLDSRVLVIAPSYLKDKIFNGLRNRNYNVVDYEMFADERHNDIKHKRIFDIFEALCVRKTDNLMLRKALQLYLKQDDIKTILQTGADNDKRIWYVLSDDIKTKIDDDIKMYKKAKTGKDHFTKKELARFSELFSLKNLISRMVGGFGSTQRGAQEVELTTVMSSKGLSADFVYYVGIDNRTMLDKETKGLTDQKVCEFLVGITRAKKKLTLYSLYDENPKILDLIDHGLIKIIKPRWKR